MLVGLHVYFDECTALLLHDGRNARHARGRRPQVHAPHRRGRRREALAFDVARARLQR